MILDAGGTTLPGVPDLEQRRAQVRQLRANGLTYDEIAATVGITFSQVQDDLNPRRRPPPRAVRFPPAVDEALVETADAAGTSVNQVVVKAVVDWLEPRGGTK